jgi:L-alanine-DL-glutamate epimerase-like enolase superfamily enzyme
MKTADNLLVRIEAGGVTGWGEAAAAPAMTGELMAGMLAAVEYLAPLLKGMPLEEVEQAAARMNRELYGNQSVKAAIEMALYDALGKATGKPVYELLGGGKRDRIPALRYLASGDADIDVADAAALKAQGYVAFKLKVGAKDLRHDIERTRRVCEVLGPGLLICADANQAWTPEQALDYVRAVADTTLAFLEQPVSGNDLAGMAKVAAATRIELGCDEGLRSVRDLKDYKEAGAASGASLKLGKLGGLKPTGRMALLCRDLGMKVNLACKIAEAGVGTAATLHMAAAIPSLEWGVALTSTYLKDDILARPIQYSAGHVLVPMGPGLGVEVDEKRVKQFSAK